MQTFMKILGRVLIVTGTFSFIFVYECIDEHNKRKHDNWSASKRYLISLGELMLIVLMVIAICCSDD